MRTVRVLFLDAFRHVLSYGWNSGVELRVTYESQWNPNSYAAPPAILDATKRLTSWNEVDLVIIGNNMGAGLKKAEAVAPAMRAKTIIVWIDYAPGLEAPYAKLGFTRFMSREDLRRRLPAIISAD